MTTRLYLDIDGVINMFDTHLFESLGGVQAVVNGYIIQGFPEKVREFLSAFDEVFWATTWVLNDAALDEFEEYLGLEPGILGRLDITVEELHFKHEFGTGKQHAVARHFDANPCDKVLWIDDMFGTADVEVAQRRGIFMFRPIGALGAYDKIADWVENGMPWDEKPAEVLDPAEV